MVYIVILNWKEYEKTIGCVKSLLSLDYPDYKIVICDNASENESIEVLSKWLGDELCESSDYQVISEDDCEALNDHSSVVFLVKNKDNYGYAGGNNVGVKLALGDERCQFVWILNNDTLADSRALSSMVGVMNGRDDLGACGSLLVDQNNRELVQALGGRLKRPFFTAEHVGKGCELRKTSTLESLLSCVEYPVGASLLIRRETIKSIGYLSEDYFLYYEEIDYVQRMKRSGLGFSVDLESIVYHEEGGSTAGGRSALAQKCYARGRLLFVKKYYPSYIMVVRFSYFLVAIKKIIKGQYEVSRYCLGLFLNGEGFVDK